MSKMGDPVGRACLIPTKHSRYVMCSDGIRLVIEEQRFSKYFIYSLINSPNFRKLVEKTATGSTRKRIGLDELKSLPMIVPSDRREQQKIADCLFPLDELIAAESQNLEALKANKKGLMQQLFPAEGETVPKHRFTEFSESGNWEFLPIGSKVDLISGYAFPGSEISEDSSGLPLMRGINITEGFIRHTSDMDRYFLGSTEVLEKFTLKENDLVIGMDGSKVGKNSALITKTDVGALLVQRVARLRADKKETIQFIFQQINSTKFHAYVDRINTSSGIPHISLKQIDAFEIPFPPSPREQEKVAKCLSSLDELITGQTERIEALKIHKKGLMQQLFPNTKELINE
jgi:type I restriction enzyme S subunit